MISFFDSNCVVGRRSIRRSGNPGEEEFYSIPDLLAEMDYAGIDEVLVYHALAKEYSPMVGNRISAERTCSLHRNGRATSASLTTGR